jgi:hypothetical protein
MVDRIAILAWGSLLWDAAEKFDAFHDAWQYDGPVLKLEFSRISESRNGALTLVLDDRFGAPATVAYSISSRTNLEDAIEDLRSREKTAKRCVGWLMRGGGEVSRDSASLGSISGWADSHNFDAVVWTDLPGNFEQKTTEPFSIDAVARYLQTLTPDGRSKAREYAQRALKAIQSPIRDLIAT